MLVEQLDPDWNVALLEWIIYLQIKEQMQIKELEIISIVFAKNIYFWWSA